MKQDVTGPNFIYVGARKSGSTWIYLALREHPDIFVVPEKSTTFFENNPTGSVEQYLQHYENSGGSKVRGEISQDAYLYPDSAQRLSELFPDIRIIICLREPRDFVRSLLCWLVTHTDRYGKTLEEVARHQHVQEITDYYALIQPYYARFPAEQIKLTFYDDLNSDPGGFLEDIYLFLGAEPSFRPEILSKVVNPTRSPRFKLLTHIAFKINIAMRKVGLGKLVEAIKRLPIVEWLLYKDSAAKMNSEALEIASKIRERMMADFDRIEQLSNTRLPDAWRRT